jgi:hypothetical protein
MDTYSNGNDSNAKKTGNPSQNSLLPFGSSPSQGEELIKPSPTGKAIPEKRDIRNHEYIEK